MARTIGALGKAKFIGVPLAKLNEIFGAGATIYVSIEHHGAQFGVNRDNLPRTATVLLGDNSAPAAPVVASIPAPIVSTEITLPAEGKRAPQAEVLSPNLDDF